MRVTFSPAFDGGAWPGPLSGQRLAALDDAWLGPTALLETLELQLGLGGDTASPSLRIASTAAAAARTSGAFFSASAQVDAIGCGRRLIEARDALVNDGLDPSALPGALPARVTALLGVTAASAPGAPDRLLAVARALEAGRATGLSRIGVDDAPLLPALWRRVLRGLAATGTEVTALLPTVAEQHGDLRAAQHAPFAPTGDGALLMLRPESIDSAADEIAVALAHEPRLEDVVVVGADAALDAALARHGGPTLAADPDDGDDELLQVLPLVVALGVGPRDPARVLELLTLSLGPVPRRVAFGLLRAMGDAPSSHGAAFAAALEKGLNELEAHQREAARTRIAALLREQPDKAQVTGDEIEQRVRVLNRWAAARAAGDEASPFRAVLAQSALFLQVLAAFTADRAAPIPREVLSRCAEEATRRAPRRAQRPALAGARHIADPAALLAPARVVLWWTFSRAAAELPRPPVAWARAERDALRAVGVDVVDPGERARQQAARSARPFVSASEQLVLVCPQHDRRGQEQHPHPAWDEIAGRAGARGAAERLIVRRLTHGLSVPRLAVTSRPVLAARDRWPVPATVARQLESPSSMEALLGCQLHFVLDTWKVRRRAVVRLADGATLFGRVAHEVMARVLKEGVTDPALADRRARAILPDVLRELADVYLLPREGQRRQTAEHSIAIAASALVNELNQRALSVRNVEQEFTFERDGRRMKGRPDLVVERRAGPGQSALAVIDIKTGSERRHEEQLAFGSAVQLAYYSYLLHQVTRADDAPGAQPDQPWPDVAYYQVHSARLLTLDARRFGIPGAPGQRPEDTMRKARIDANAAFDNIIDGQASAPGALEDVEPERDKVVPPCRFCPHDLVCGRAFADRRRR